MTYRQDESYSLAAHVSWTLREILGRRYDVATAWNIIRQLWTCAILDSREPMIMQRPAGWKPTLLEGGQWFLDPFGATAKESMLRTWPELAEAFRSQSQS